MEVKEEEVKICRLCGQSENICIDVFSEDGTSRLLRIKIHSKINILIDERDPLPKTICVHCVGKLEFVCDFQEECLRTQQLLRDRYNLPPLSDVIEEDDELPTAVCVKCIGALEFLCDFYDWCHRTQQNFLGKAKRSSAESDSQFSTDESDKENVLPANNAKRKIKTKVSPTEPLKKVSEPEELFESETTEKSSVNKESDTIPVASGKKVSNPEKEVPVSSEKEVSVSSEKEVSVSSEKEVSVSSEKEVSASSGNPSRKEFSSEKKIAYSFGKELFVSLRKEVFPLVKSGSTLTDPVSISTEQISTSMSISTSASKVVPNETRDTRADKKQKEGTRRSGDKSILTPLTVWLTGSSMNKKRKRDESLVQDKVTISKLSESKYSKISELMTDEQKKAIENYYRVDMSLVDEIKVAENMKIYSRNEIECKICKQKYNRMDKCQVHIWRHLDMKPYQCNACSFSTLTVSNIRCHIRKSHLKIKPYACHICEKQYTSATSLEEHVNIHTGAKPYRCSLCEFSSSSKQVLSYHKLTHKNQKDVACDVCGKTFYSKSRLRTHKFIHIKDSAFKCKYCSTYFMQQEALNKHYSTVHTQDYQCNICNKSYKSKKALNNHQNVHSEAKYQCPMCPSRYKSHHILKEHILKHGGIRKYKCETCGKTFAQQSHLAAHMSVHIGIRYECPGCKKGFNRHDNMKVHTKRCNDFLRNPALKELLTKKVKTESISSADTAMDTMSVSSRGSINSAKTSASSAKKILTKVELNMDSENSDEESDSESMYDFTKAGKSLYPCTVSDDDEDSVLREKISVTENILSPECF